ncbi:geranylgeranyl reductase [Propionibacterium sp. oral taxon 192 str. F0372]|nr:geranylgeranyl reductase [Propionibacterium sp. oral taxon 192 str. F0372]
MNAPVVGQPGGTAGLRRLHWNPWVDCPGGAAKGTDVSQVTSTVRGPRASLLDTETPTGDQQAEVIVVGAGPAGSATATFLARYGVDVVLLDKARFPRDKICGDGLTPRSVRMLARLGIDTSPEAGWHHLKGLRVYGGRVGQLDMEWPVLKDFPNYGLVCPRIVLDDLLAGNAVEAGAKLYTGVRVTEPVIDATGHVKGVKDATGRVWSAPVVVAADGNSARLAVNAGRSHDTRAPMGVAVRAYYESPKHDMEWIESWLELRDGTDLLPGYGWAFPTGAGTVNVGLGMLNSSAAFGNTDYRELQRRWLASTPPEWGFTEVNRVTEIRGAALPMCLNRQPLYADGLLLVGDAAGMISPFNGEGIDYAMEAGQYAATAIVDAKSRGFGTSGAELALNNYGVVVKEAWGSHYRLGKAFVKLIGNPRIMHLCVHYGLSNRRLMILVNKLLANLTDRHDGDVYDKIINSLEKLAPSG